MAKESPGRRAARTHFYELPKFIDKVCQASGVDEKAGKTLVRRSLAG
ncbi:hypothetical protein BKA00_006252 [Actinomadura coerulea]|uniref:Uncharacterized protein n=1 Tax=Actinomadura coerulea TaxID=46159 RepID=A0A7X0G4N4_9ACTN|nr:hypothetical protein [Actinomadura coerulea]